MANDSQSLLTASKKVRHLGAAHSGTGAARLMHITSVALVPLTVAFVWILVSVSGKDYAGVRAELGRPCPAILMLFFIAVGAVHMYVGMRAIIDDYVHDRHWKEGALMANLFFAAVIGVSSIYAVLQLSFVPG